MMADTIMVGIIAAVTIIMEDKDTEAVVITVDTRMGKLKDV